MSHRRRFALLIAVFGSLLAAAPAQAIVAGRAVSTDVDPFPYPWQVAVITSSSETADQWLCGGTLVAPDLVLTAAHCVLEDDGRIAPPANVYALNGSTDLNDSSAGPSGTEPIMTFTGVDDIALYPALDVSHSVPSGDLALLHLSAPPPAGRPLHVVDDTQVGWWAVAQRLRVIGWGVTSATSTTPVTGLRWASVFRTADDACGTAYPGTFTAATMFCATGQPLIDDPNGPVGDTCLGDSGGPIAAALTNPTQPANPDAWTLVGVTSWGTGCGDPAHPGVYTRLGDPSLRAFATSTTPVWAGVNLTAPAMQADAANVGDTVTCTPGTWRGDGLAFTYEFHRITGPGTSTVVQTGTSNTYVVTSADTAGLECVELATNAGGTAWAQSGTTPVTPVTVPPQQVPGTETPRVPAPPAVSDEIAGQAEPGDVAAPKASKASASCKSRLCTISVRVTDAAPSSGIRRVSGTVTYKQACRKKGRRTTCTKTAKVTGKLSKGTTWTLKLPRLPKGRASIAITVVDKSGRTTTRPAKLTFRVR